MPENPPPPPPPGSGDSKAAGTDLMQWIKDVVTGPYSDDVKLKTIEEAKIR